MTSRTNVLQWGKGGIAPWGRAGEVVAESKITRRTSMNERADAERLGRAMPNTPTVEDERQRFEEACFTQREWQRLVFLRWLYSRGLLTEWP